MSSPESQSRSQTSAEVRTRRRHRKSRQGCVECKRRRIKCDESKPSCIRCVTLLKKCVYQTRPPDATNDRSDEPSLPSPARSALSPSPRASSSCSVHSPPINAPTHSSTTLSQGNSWKFDAEALPGLTDTDLYHHFLQHTSRTLNHNQRDQGALQIGMPTLALQSKTVYHSILALSAACICCDMITQATPPQISHITQALATGYRHYNLASEQMRELISQSDATKLEPLLASGILLVPFATASQQINHWVSSQSSMQEFGRHLSTTPRDVIVIMRGIKTTLQALQCRDISQNLDLYQPMESTMGSSSSWAEGNIPLTGTPPSHNHVMFPILVATSEGAFDKLRDRLELASLRPDFIGYEQYRDDSISACTAAFEVLSRLRSATFLAHSSTSSPPSNTPAERIPMLLPQLAPWLRSYIDRASVPLPTEPLTRPFLTFLVQVPQAYLDLILPLLDQRLETPMDTSVSPIEADLTWEQALALDIYAHWSVLMFLVEHESWWIGRLPTITLTGMINRYGEEFVTRVWSDCDDDQERWWPASMLAILKEVEQYR